MDKKTPLYDEDYYLRGPETGKSNYKDYRWMGHLTLPMAKHLIDYLQITDRDSVLDFGCARGYMVRALRELRIDAWGYDISEWAIQNCDQSVVDYVSLNWKNLPKRFDHIYLKDVLEHLDSMELEESLDHLAARFNKSMFIIVPLCGRSGDYLRNEDRIDSTHMIRLSLEGWMDLLCECLPNDFIITGSWHYPGLKPASDEVYKSCGFFKVTRK